MADLNKTHFLALTESTQRAFKEHYESNQSNKIREAYKYWVLFISGERCLKFHRKVSGLSGLIFLSQNSLQLLTIAM